MWLGWLYKVNFSNLPTGVLNAFVSSQMAYSLRYLLYMLSEMSLLIHLDFSLKAESIVSTISMFSLHLVVEPVVSALILVRFY